MVWDIVSVTAQVSDSHKSSEVWFVLFEVVPIFLVEHRPWQAPKHDTAAHSLPSRGMGERKEK